MGSLAVYDKFEYAELCRFRQIFHLKIEDTITSSEAFPDKMLSLKKVNVSLLEEIYKVLVDYYNAIYDFDFLTILKSVQRNAVRSGYRIVV